MTVPYYIPRFSFPASLLMLVTQHLLLSVFFILIILADMRWYLVVLISIYLINNDIEGFPGGTVVKNLPPNAGDTREAGSIPGLGRSPSVGNGNPLQYSCLENSKDRGAWRATVHRVTKSQTRLSDLHFPLYGFPGGASCKEPTCQCRRHKDTGLIPGSGRSP